MYTFPGPASSCRPQPHPPPSGGLSPACWPQALSGNIFLPTCPHPLPSLLGSVYARVRGVKQEQDVSLYTLLHLKWISNKILPRSTGNSARCYVVAWMGGEFGVHVHGYMYMYRIHVHGYMYMYRIHVHVRLSCSAVHLKSSQCCQSVIRQCTIKSLKKMFKKASRWLPCGEIRAGPRRKGLQNKTRRLSPGGKAESCSLS